ncbi:MAG TPA: hypothetical protein PKX46_00965 [Clostridia bacterium]|nr:hypothetical protein [Clostridia bacterium]
MNAALCIEQLGINILHATAHKTAVDKSTSGNTDIFFGGAVYPPEDRFSVGDTNIVRRIVEAMQID